MVEIARQKKKIETKYFKMVEEYKEEEKVVQEAKACMTRKANTISVQNKSTKQSDWQISNRKLKVSKQKDQYEEQIKENKETNSLQIENQKTREEKTAHGLELSEYKRKYRNKDLREVTKIRTESIEKDKGIRETPMKQKDNR